MILARYAPTLLRWLMTPRHAVAKSELRYVRNLARAVIDWSLLKPGSPKPSTGAIARFATIAPEERDRMGRASRVKAEALLDAGGVAGHYLRILEAAAERKALKIGHWPEQVPETALRASGPSRGGHVRR